MARNREGLEGEDVPPSAGAETRRVAHWSDCWRDPKHHACAVRKVEELMEYSASQEKALDMMERGHL